jgi:hypothetical protein
LFPIITHPPHTITHPVSLFHPRDGSPIFCLSRNDEKKSMVDSTSLKA